MNIQTIVVGSYEVNCYIISGDGKNAIIIDPGFEYDTIKKALDKSGLNPFIVINTHGHADHIGTNPDWNVPVWIGEADALSLTDPERNLSTLVGTAISVPEADRLLHDGEKCEACGLQFTVLHTPGHSPGGICLLFDDCVFTGDTLFYSSIGRTDFPGSDSRAIITSIKDKLMTLHDDIKVYPGHGPQTSIGFERKNNYFVR